MLRTTPRFNLPVADIEVDEVAGQILESAKLATSDPLLRLDIIDAMIEYCLEVEPLTTGLYD